MRRIVPIMIAGLALAGVAACSSSTPQDKVLAEVASQDKADIYARAEKLYEQGKYKDARRYYQFLYDTFPYDPLGHKAALRIADTYFQFKDTTNLTEARLRYRDFANRYPNDPDRDYALLMLGESYYAKRGRPDRDLTNARAAIDAFEQLVKLYPDSEHAQEARERLASLHQMLAFHEWQIARFYARNKEWRAVVQRLEYLQEHYPDYPQMERVDTLLTTARSKLQSATEPTAETDSIDEVESLE